MAIDSNIWSTSVMESSQQNQKAAAKATKIQHDEDSSSFYQISFLFLYITEPTYTSDHILHIVLHYSHHIC